MNAELKFHPLTDIFPLMQGAEFDERTINRGDARGAPYVFVAGVKYRPETRYNEFLLSHITQARRLPRDRRRRTPTI